MGPQALDDEYFYSQLAAFITPLCIIPPECKIVCLNQTSLVILQLEWILDGLHANFCALAAL